MEELSFKCSDYLIQKRVIPIEDRDIYVYGFELIFTTVFSAISALLISIIFDQTVQGMLFFCIFYYMRLFAGGYHANTHIGCFLITNVIFLIGLIYMRLLSEFPVWGRCVGQIMAIIYIWLSAPIVHKDQPLTEVKFMRNKKKIRQCIVVEVVVLCFLYCNRLSRVALPIEAAILAVFFMMLIKNKRRIQYVKFD